MKLIHVVPLIQDKTHNKTDSINRRDPQQNQQHQSSRYSTPDNSVFQRSNGQESSGSVPTNRNFLKLLNNLALTQIYYYGRFN